MRRIVLLAVSTAVLAACGASAASTKSGPMQIEFGLNGGNMAPFQVTIERTGRIRPTGFLRPSRRRISPVKVASLSRLVRQAFASGLKSRRCAQMLPDVGSDYIHAAGRTVRVQGNCEPRFTQLWDTLARAVGLRVG